MREIVTASAQVNFLCNRGSLADFDFAQAVSVGAISETGAVAQREVPRNFNSRALMDEWLAFDLRAEHVEPEKPPWVRRFRRPAAKHEPAKFPKQSHRAILDGPGRFLRHALLRFYRGFGFHGKSPPNQAERQPRLNRDFHGWVDRGFAITASNESVAPSISKWAAKQFRAFCRISAREVSGVATQRFRRLTVPARSSFST